MKRLVVLFPVLLAITLSAQHTLPECPELKQKLIEIKSYFSKLENLKKNELDGGWWSTDFVMCGSTASVRMRSGNNLLSLVFNRRFGHEYYLPFIERVCEELDQLYGKTHIMEVIEFDNKRSGSYTWTELNKSITSSRTIISVSFMLNNRSLVLEFLYNEINKQDTK